MVSIQGKHTSVDQTLPNSSSKPLTFWLYYFSQALAHMDTNALANMVQNVVETSWFSDHAVIVLHVRASSNLHEVNFSVWMIYFLCSKSLCTATGAQRPKRSPWLEASWISVLSANVFLFLKHQHIVRLSGPDTWRQESDWAHVPSPWGPLPGATKQQLRTCLGITKGLTVQFGLGYFSN